MHIPLGKGCFKVRGTKEDPIPCVTKIKLAYISVQSWIVQPQSYMDYLRSIKPVPPSGQSGPAGVQSPMGWLKSLLRYLNP